ncbi:MAG: hypothetical protein CL496_01060 [Actinobacteria bacterium]|nr:hypothetical protein [Actinomycetota bacterium]
MGSTLVLISLMLSLSIAVIFPELKYSKSNINVHTDEYDFMVDKQRRGFLILGLLAVVTFFVSLQTLSVGLFLLHLVIDILFGVYAYASLQVRAASIQRRNMAFMNDVTFEDESIEYFKQAV